MNDETWEQTGIRRAAWYMLAGVVVLFAGALFPLIKPLSWVFATMFVGFAYYYLKILYQDAGYQ